MPSGLLASLARSCLTKEVCIAAVRLRHRSAASTRPIVELTPGGSLRHLNLTGAERVAAAVQAGHALVRPGVVDSATVAIISIGIGIVQC